MDRAYREAAERMRSLLANGATTPAVFRSALTRVPPAHRDAWLDLVLGIDRIPEDGPDLPRACVPYMPCSVDTLLRMVDRANVQPADVFVDIGSGLGRAALLTHFLTGAAAIGIEIQSELVRCSRCLTRNFRASPISVVEGDAVRLIGFIPIGSVFFLYCPFSGERLESVLNQLEAIARTRPIRVCSVDLPLPPCPWLTPVSAPPGDLAVYRSTFDA